MSSIIAAWLVGEGLIIYRQVAVQKKPPFPADLLATSGLFVLISFLAGPAPQFAGLLAWGFDIASFMKISVDRQAIADAAAAAKAKKKG